MDARTGGATRTAVVPAAAVAPPQQQQQHRAHDADNDDNNVISLDYALSDAYLDMEGGSGDDGNSRGGGGGGDGGGGNTDDHGEPALSLDAHRRERRERARRRRRAAPSPLAMAAPPLFAAPSPSPAPPQARLGRGIPAAAAHLPDGGGGGGGGGGEARRRRRHAADAASDSQDGGGRRQQQQQPRHGGGRGQQQPDASIEDEDEDGDSSYLPSVTERQKHFRNAFGDIFDSDEGASGVPCFACEVLNGRVHTVKNSKLSAFMLKLTARDRIMTYDVGDYVRLANEYEETIRQPHNRRLKPGQTPLPPFPAARIYQHIHRPHIKNRHLRMELLVHDMFDLAEEMKDELRVEHMSLRHADGRPVKRTRKKTMQAFNTLLVQLKHYNSYLDGIPAEQRMEALQASAIAYAGYGTERLLDKQADRREDLLAEMMGHDGAGILQEGDGGGPGRKRARHR